MSSLALAAGLACSSNKTTGESDSHATGALVVVASTTGQDLGAAYAVFVDSGPAQLLLANGSTRPDTGLPTGAHTLTVAHIPSNCSVHGGNAIPVTIVAHTQVADTISVSCSATTRHKSS